MYITYIRICQGTFGLILPLGYCEECFYERECEKSLFKTPFSVFDVCPEVGLLNHMVVLFLTFWSLYTVFHSCCTILQSHQQCTSVLMCSHEDQHFLFLFFLPSFLPPSFHTVPVLVGVRWHLTAALICISLMIINTEHLSICLLTTYIPSLEKQLFKFFTCFKNRLSDVLLLNCRRSLYILDTNS